MDERQPGGPGLINVMGVLRGHGGMGVEEFWVHSCGLTLFLAGGDCRLGFLSISSSLFFFLSLFFAVHS